MFLYYHPTIYSVTTNTYIKKIKKILNNMHYILITLYIMYIYEHSNHPGR